MRLLGNRLLVEDLQPPLSATLAIPDSCKPKPSEVRILQLGSGVKDPALAVGQTVDMTKAYGFIAVPGREKELIVSVRDVLCIYQETQ